MTETRQDKFLETLSACLPQDQLSPGVLNVYSKSAFDKTGQMARILYKTDDLVKRIVDQIVETALKDWVEADDELIECLHRYSAKSVLKKAGVRSRLFGGALVVVWADDSDDLQEPLNPDRISSIEGFQVFERSEVSIFLSDYQTDPSKKNYGCVEFYTVDEQTPAFVKRHKIHHSRCFRLNGIETTNYDSIVNEGWGDSVLAGTAKSIANYNYAIGAIPSIMKDFVQLVIKLEGMTDQLSVEGGEKVVSKRLKVLNEARSLLNAVVVGTGDEYTKSSSSVAGMSDLIDKSMLHLSAVSGMPQTLLFGRAPQGMSSTGEHDMDNWHQKVAEFQEMKLGPLLQWMIDLLSYLPDFKVKEDEISWQWPDLAPLDEKDRSEIKLKNAQTDKIYVEMGAIHPEFLYQERHQDTYRFDVVFSKEQYDNWINEYEPKVDFSEAPSPSDDPTSSGADLQS
jgi:uncharacterized protein